MFFFVLLGWYKMAKRYKMLPTYDVNFSKHNIEIINYNLQLHDVPFIWAQTKGEGIKIGLLDTGLPNHPDVNNKIKGFFNFTTDTSVYDGDGHSTHCAGKLVAESTNPNVGMVGIAPKADLYIGKVMTDSGMGNDEWLAQGIYWCIEQGCHIINMSLGAPAKAEKKFKKTRAAILEGKRRNIHFFAAAGNEGINSIAVPAKWNEVFCIGSIDKNAQHSPFSNYGPEMDFVGLGSDVISTYLGGNYASLSGTSMATPDIAAIAALILSRHLKDEGRIIDFYELRNELRKISTDLAKPGFDPKTGHGNPVFGKNNNIFDPNDMSGIVATEKKPWWKSLWPW